MFTGVMAYVRAADLLTEYAAILVCFHWLTELQGAEAQVALLSRRGRAMLCVRVLSRAQTFIISYFGFRFTTGYNCCLVVFGVTLKLLVIHTSSASPVKIKRSRLPATSVINLPRSVAAVRITSGGRTVDSTRWSQILAANPDFCLPHLHSTPQYCHNVC